MKNKKKGYRRHVYKGISWVGFLRLSVRAITLIRTSILARILTPAQFGLIGIATLALSLIEIFTETGINIFLIQENKKLDTYINTVWIVSILRGALISLLIIAFSPLVVYFFDSPNAYSLLLLISIVPFVRGFINPSIVIFQKELQFNKEFYFRSFLFFIDSVVAISIAFYSLSASSIIFGLIASSLMETILSFIIIKPIPRLNFNNNQFIKILHAGRWITAAGIFNYLFHNADSIVVGKLMGVSSLGIYNVAYKISILPITEISDSVSRVTFPVYAKIADDLNRLKKAFIKTTLLLTISSIGFGLVLYVFTKELVLIILGDQWLQAVPIIKVLVIFGVIRGITGSSSALFLAIKKQKYVTLVTFVSILGLGITIVPFIMMFGLVGAAISALAGSIFALPVIIYFVFKIFNKN